MCGEYQSKEWHGDDGTPEGRRRRPRDESRRRLIEGEGWAVVFIHPEDVLVEVKAHALNGHILQLLHERTPRP